VVTVDVLHALNVVAPSAEAVLVDFVLAGNCGLARIALLVVVLVNVVGASNVSAASIALEVAVCIGMVGAGSTTTAAGCKHTNSHNKNEQETKDSCFHGFSPFFLMPVFLRTPLGGRRRFAE
jgi:hypothetical protein